jgi:hypothetical protein
MKCDPRASAAGLGRVFLVPIPRPNNRLQGMRGLAFFQRDESLARRPRTPDPCVVRRLGGERFSVPVLPSGDPQLRGMP